MIKRISLIARVGAVISQPSFDCEASCPRNEILKHPPPVIHVLSPWERVASKAVYMRAKPLNFKWHA